MPRPSRRHARDDIYSRFLGPFATVSLLGVGGSGLLTWDIPSRAASWWLSCWLIGLSLIAFIAYGVDKAQARAQGARISERTLLALALAGGALGALGAMAAFRHKTLHTMMLVINLLSAIVQILLHIALFADMLDLALLRAIATFSIR